MDDETILLLVKEKKFEEAISKYIDKKKFVEAEKFCSSYKSEGLLTKLLEKYFYVRRSVPIHETPRCQEEHKVVIFRSICCLMLLKTLFLFIFKAKIQTCVQKKFCIVEYWNLFNPNFSCKAGISRRDMIIENVTINPCHAIF